MSAVTVPAETKDDVLSEFFWGVAQLAAGCQQKLEGRRLAVAGSRCAAWAVEAGLPVQMAYTIRQTADYTGLDAQTLRSEIRAGRLAVVIPAGCEKGMRVRVDDMDRWIEENTRL